MDISNIENELDAIAKRYNLRRKTPSPDRANLPPMHSKSPSRISTTSSQARNMNTEQLEQLLLGSSPERVGNTSRQSPARSQVSRQSPGRTATSGVNISRDWTRDPSTSSAIASAMKALQEKINFLEQENVRLKHAASSTEEKYFNDRELFEKRFQNETAVATSKEKDLTIDISQLEGELRILKSKNEQLTDANTLLQTRATMAESENARMIQQFKIDKENWTLKFDKLKNKRGLKKVSDESVIKGLEKAEGTREKLLERLAKLEEDNEGLQDELDRLKSVDQKCKDSMKDSMSKVEQDLTRNNQSQIRKLKKAQMTNKDLKTTIMNQKSQMESLRGQLGELQDPKENRKPKRASSTSIDSIPKWVSKTSNSTARKPRPSEHKKCRKTRLCSVTEESPLRKSPLKKQPLMISPRRKQISTTSKNRASSAHSARNTKSTPKNSEQFELQATARFGDKDLSMKIGELEKEINEYSSNYKHLLEQSHNSDLPSLRGDLNKLTDLMESRSEELFALKRKQNFGVLQ